MVNLSSEYFNSEIDFSLSRAVLQSGTVGVVPKPLEGKGSRIYRFFTFQKNADLLAVNKTLANAGNLIDDIAKMIFQQDVAKRENLKNNVITNLTLLNEKFIRGNKMNFLSGVILRVINFIRSYFGKEAIGYKELNIKDIESQLLLKLTQMFNADQKKNDDKVVKGDETEKKEEPVNQSGAIVPYTGKLPVPQEIVPLFTGGLTSNNPLTLNQVWTLIPQEQQLAVEKLFQTGELTLHHHVISMTGQGGTSNIALEAEGDVTLTLEEEDLQGLQQALTGSADPQSRLLACMVLVGAGDKALPLLTGLEKGEVKTIEGVTRLLLLGAPPTESNNNSQTEASPEEKPTKTEKPHKSVLDRITDTDNPPILKVDKNPFSVRLDTKKGRFIIENLSENAMYLNAEGIIYRGRYCKYIDSRPPFVLVKKDERSHDGDLVGIEILENCYYKLSYGGPSHMIISHESLSKMQDE